MRGILLGLIHLSHAGYRVTSVLVSRFLLDLQEANQNVIKIDLDYSVHSGRGWSSSSLIFAAAVEFFGVIIEPRDGLLDETTNEGDNGGTDII